MLFAVFFTIGFIILSILSHSPLANLILKVKYPEKFRPALDEEKNLKSRFLRESSKEIILQLDSGARVIINRLENLNFKFNF